MIQETSLQVYKDIIEEGIVNKRQIQILKYIKENPNSTDREISEDLELKINMVTGRRNELVDFGLVENTGKRHCYYSKRTVFQWCIKKELNKENILKNKSKLYKKQRCPFCQGKGYLIAR